MYFGTSFLIGVASSLELSSTLLLFIALFWLLMNLPFWSKIAGPKFLLSLLLFLSAYAYSSWINHYPLLPDRGLQGTALLHITSLTYKASFIGKSWNYLGKITQFVPQNSALEDLTNIPALVCLSDKELQVRPPADRSYLIQGRLKRSRSGKYILTPLKNQPWYAIPDTWSSAEWRFKAKKAVNEYIKQKVPNEPSCSYLSAIATGEFENRMLTYEFSRFGLQHIIPAIFGFHFAIVASLLGIFLSFILGRRIALIALVLPLSIYFLFLGTAPSVIRAWVSCILAFAAFLLEKVPSGLNSLGIGLLVVLIMDPEMIRHIGFQFSFAVSASILLFYSSIDHCLQIFFPKRSLDSVTKMNFPNLHGFIILALFRQALALTISVNIVAIPITLYYFQNFPLMSILYNFFFPFMVSLSMLLLIAGWVFDLLSPILGNFFHSINASFSQFTLDYTFLLPRHLDINFYLSLNQEIVIIFLQICFVAGIYLRHHLRKTGSLRHDLALV